MLQIKVPLEVNQLLSQLHIVEPYPPGVLRLPDEAAGRPFLPQIAFFPGGSGLWMDDLVTQPSKFPIGGVMIIAKDFDSETAYHDTRKLMQEGKCNPCERNKTFKNLIPFLEEVGISLETCFLTNFFMGLREGDESEGKFPGARDASYVKRCQEFIKVQLKIQQPRLVLTLGTEVFPKLALLSSQLSRWSKVRSFPLLDIVGPVAHKVQFPCISTTCSVVALIHMSRHYGNVSKCNRTYKNFHGHEAEVAMVRDALQVCGM